LVVVLFFFNLWNWYLASKGTTAIEHWGMKRPKHTGERYDFSYSSRMDNLILIFGTYNIVKMLMPSRRPLPMNGLEYTFEALHNKESTSSQLDATTAKK